LESDRADQEPHVPGPDRDAERAVGAGPRDATAVLLDDRRADDRHVA
jgi:hypothetical protein